MSFPSWADPEISKVLAKIRADGERQTYEFKADFPPDGRKIGKSVAAMATAGGGLILIGVRDDGTVAGLEENEVDRLCLRAHSLAEEVKPSVAHKVTPCYDQGFILVICVHADQARPVFYYDGKPYVRVGRRSRPATPEEMEERILAHPSAVHKKQLEDLTYEQAKTAAELAAKRTAEWDDLALKSAANHQSLMARSRESFQQTNEMVRQSFVPK